jgi:lysophospholipase L1-like esterase
MWFTGFVRGIFDPGDTAWVGDSISTPTYGNTPALYAGLTGRGVENWAVSGEGFISSGNQIQTQYDSKIRQHSRVVIEGGINDLLAGSTASETATATIAFVDLIRASGKTVILNNIAPCKAYSGCSSLSSTISTYNSILSSAMSSRPDVIYIDLNTLWNDGSDNCRCCVDGIHPNSTCASDWADQVATQAP